LKPSLNLPSSISLAASGFNLRIERYRRLMTVEVSLESHCLINCLNEYYSDSSAKKTMD
jgi:hypothetical protein